MHKQKIPLAPVGAHNETTASKIKSNAYPELNGKV
jgi:hypothetical protein